MSEKLPVQDTEVHFTNMCKKGKHLFTTDEDEVVRCFYCGKPFEEYKMEYEKK